MDFVQEHLHQFRSKLDKYPMLQEVEDKIKVPKEIVVLAGLMIFGVIIIFGVGIASLTSIVGFLYPAFKSFQAIETKSKGDDTQWLVYWVIFAFFSIIETFVDILLYWIPFYYTFKLAFLMWAMMPQTKGAKFLYDSFLKDFLKKNESAIDAALSDARKNASSIASEFAAAGSDVASAVASAASGENKKTS